MPQLLIVAGAVILGVLIVSTVIKVFGLVIMIGLWMLAGYLAAKLVRGQNYGPLGDTALGFCGAIVGSIIMGLVGLGGLSGIWLVGTVIAGVVGGVIILYAMQLNNEHKDKPAPKTKVDVH